MTSERLGEIAAYIQRQITKNCSGNPEVCEECAKAIAIANELREHAKILAIKDQITADPNFDPSEFADILQAQLRGDA